MERNHCGWRGPGQGGGGCRWVSVASDRPASRYRRELLWQLGRRGCGGCTGSACRTLVDEGQGGSCSQSTGGTGSKESAGSPHAPRFSRLPWTRLSPVTPAVAEACDGIPTRYAIQGHRRAMGPRAAPGPLPGQTVGSKRVTISATCAGVGMWSMMRRSSGLMMLTSVSM